MFQQRKKTGHERTQLNKTVSLINADILTHANSILKQTTNKYGSCRPQSCLTMGAGLTVIEDVRVQEPNSLENLVSIDKHRKII